MAVVPGVAFRKGAVCPPALGWENGDTIHLGEVSGGAFPNIMNERAAFAAEFGSQGPSRVSLEAFRGSVFYGFVLVLSDLAEAPLKVRVVVTGLPWPAVACGKSITAK